jgi:hypothetical protein
VNEVASPPETGSDAKSLQGETGLQHGSTRQAAAVEPPAAAARDQQGAGIPGPEFRQDPPKKKLRIAICAAQENLGQYLSRLLESYGFEVVQNIPLVAAQIFSLDPEQFDVLLVDRPETGSPLSAPLAGFFARWNGPLLYNDSLATETSLRQANPDFGVTLTRQITSLADSARAGSTAINL